MNEVDFLDQLGVPVVGMPKDFVPHFLARYKDAASVEDVGAIVQPNFERVYAARPDLILITSLQANHYQELSEMAPTVHFDVDYRDSEARHIDVIKNHLLILGQIFDKQALARQKVDELDAKVEEVRHLTEGRPEKALVVLYNNGAFSSFGVQSRYGFIFNALGVKPASATSATGLHGQPVSSEFIQQAELVQGIGNSRGVEAVKQGHQCFVIKVHQACSGAMALLTATRCALRSTGWASEHA